MHHEILAPVQHGGGGATPCATWKDKNRRDDLKGMDPGPSTRVSPCFGLDYLWQVHRETQSSSARLDLKK